MNRAELAKKLGVEKLQEIFVREYFIGKSEAEIVVQKNYEKAQKKIEGFKFEEEKKFFCLIELIEMKNNFFNLNYLDFAKLLIEGKSYNLTFDFRIKTELDEINNIANYFLDYHDFKKSRNFFVESQLTQIKDSSLLYHSTVGLSSKSSLYFDSLNELNLIDDFNWNWNTFDFGLKSILMNHSTKMISIQSDAKLKIEQYKLKYERKIEDLIYDYEDTIKDLNFEIKLNKEDLKYNTDYYDKYYKETPIPFYETYFGDNLPFIAELYKFLKKGNLFKYGFSYFHSCLLINSNEKINIEYAGKNNYVGRILYRLSDFLIKDYRVNYFKFYQSKFLFNNSPILDNFKSNHMKIKYDENIDYELLDLDKFFDKLTKIYIKY